MIELDVVVGAAAVRQALLERRSRRAERPSPADLARSRQIFGESLTPEQAVDRILADVRARGDAAVREWTRRIDGVDLADLEVPRAVWADPATIRSRIDADLWTALECAADRIRAFHERQRRTGWIDFAAGYGQLVVPLARVGVYAPGGRASYPSTVLMTAIPARVAGVEEVILTTPCDARGEVPAVTLAAAALAGVDRVFRIGGAQAIGALAYGTASVPRVDKICGPGNRFVVLAMQKVFGVTGVAGLPGPTETLVIADESADPTAAALDLLAQAEHDPLASPILLATSVAAAERIAAEVTRCLADLPRRAIAEAALTTNGLIGAVEGVDMALELANDYAPEHLCLLVRDAWGLVGRVRNAGGVFVGEHSAEALGDYVAGPSHVMPTGGTARFASPLNVDDFTKIVSVFALDQATVARLGPTAATIARAEGLEAHARAAEARRSTRSP